MHFPIKVHIESHHHTHEVSSHVQDSIIPISSLLHTPEDRSFRFLAQRFCWHHYHRTNEPHRVHSGIHFHHVESVHKRNVPLHHPDKFLNLLTILAQKEGREIRLIFSEHSEILLKLEKFSLKVKDIGDPFPTHTVPDHTKSLKF
jgi:hypothetical protein